MSMGAIKPELPLLPRVQDRMTFLYLEMCVTVDMLEDGLDENSGTFSVIS